MDLAAEGEGYQAYDFRGERQPEEGSDRRGREGGVSFLMVVSASLFITSITSFHCTCSVCETIVTSLVIHSAQTVRPEDWSHEAVRVPLTTPCKDVMTRCANVFGAASHDEGKSHRSEYHSSAASGQRLTHRLGASRTFHHCVDQVPTLSTARSVRYKRSVRPSSNHSSPLHLSLSLPPSRTSPHQPTHPHTLHL